MKWQKTAEAFAQARKTGGGLAQYPGTVPESLREAYAIQDHIIALTGQPIAGWKVGRVAAAQAAYLGADRLVGPVFSGHIFFTQPGVIASAPAYANGFVAAEAEFMMRVGEQVDPDRPNYTLEEAAGVIDEVRIGIEIASSPFTGINDNGAAVTVSDLGNSKALMIGAVVPFGGQTDFVSWPVTTTVDSKMVGEGRADALPDGPFGAVRFLLEHLAQRGIALPVGSWISTGAITGVHVISVGTRVVATFGSDYRIVCTTHPFTAG